METERQALRALAPSDNSRPESAAKRQKVKKILDLAAGAGAQRKVDATDLIKNPHRKAQHVLINLQGKTLVPAKPQEWAKKPRLTECGSCTRRFCERHIDMCDECGLSFCIECDGTNGLAQGECMKCRMGYNRFDMREAIKKAEENAILYPDRAPSVNSAGEPVEYDEHLGEYLSEFEREHFGRPALPGDERYNDHDERVRRGESDDSEGSLYGEDGEPW